MDLERDQFVDATSQPVPRAALSTRATVALWALRVFVVLVSLMVIYTFFDHGEHDWHWRLILVAHRFGHAAAVPAVRTWR
jgi:hypothetical protein